MTTPCKDAERYAKLIDAIVLDEMPATEWPALRDHLRGCDGCQARYNRAALAARMLNGGPAAAFTPTEAEFDRIALAAIPDEPKRGFFGRLLAALGPAQKLGLGLAATAALAAVVVFPVMKAKQPSDEFQPRGSATNKGNVDFFATHPGVAPTERGASVRAFCIEGDRVSALIDGSHCAKDGQLKLAVTNRGRYEKVFLVGVDANREVKWYAPRPPEQGSVPAPQEGIDVPVAGALKVGVNHDLGRVRIYALFSDQPIAAEEVEKAAKDLQLPLPETLPLNRSDVLQRSLSFEVVP
jgi:hypothetical protein